MREKKTVLFCLHGLVLCFTCVTCRKVWSCVCIHTLPNICCNILCCVWPCWYVVRLHCHNLFLLIYSLMLSHVHQLQLAYHFFSSQTWTLWETLSSPASHSSLEYPSLNFSINTGPVLTTVLFILMLDGWVFVNSYGPLHL